jgi:DtxR family Mn-dependent transcriptional regulator
MLSKLAEAGLVTRVPYGGVSLTAQGRVLALRMTRRHRLLETWLVAEFGYGWHEVHVEAEVLEHAVSDRLLELVDRRLGHPRRDPHGDPIPGADGSVVRVEGMLVSEVEIGCRGTLVRVSDRVPGLLVELSHHGIALDTEVVKTSTDTLTVVSSRSGGTGTAAPRASTAGAVDFRLDRESATALWISPK